MCSIKLFFVNSELWTSPQNLHSRIYSHIQLLCLKMTSCSMTILLTLLLWIVYGHSMIKIRLIFFSVLLRYNIHMKSTLILSFLLSNWSIHIITIHIIHVKTQNISSISEGSFLPLINQLLNGYYYSDFCITYLAMLVNSCKWNHTVYSLLCLTFFAHQNIYETHPCCPMLSAIFF